MSTGIGRTQRRILDELAIDPKLSVMDLASRLGLRDNQVRRAVHALADRELVVLTREHAGWKGVGEYGPLRDRSYAYWDYATDTRIEYGPEVPTAKTTISRWIDDIDEDGNPLRIPVRTEYVHAGMPTGVSLFVWTPQAHAADQHRLDAFRAAFAGE